MRSESSAVAQPPLPETIRPSNPHRSQEKRLSGNRNVHIKREAHDSGNLELSKVFHNLFTSQSVVVNSCPYHSKRA